MIVNPKSLVAKVNALYEKGLPPGYSSGWAGLNKHYTVAPGQWTLVTGQPGHGKSEFVDALMVNLTRQGWKFIVWSAENLPQEIHISKLMEKYAGKPFGKGPTERMDETDRDIAFGIVDMDFTFIQPKDMLNVDMIIEAASGVIQGHDHQGPWGVVMDPWNELEHNRPQGQSETEYISQSLSKVRAWAREWNVHVFIVAHPAKLQRDKEGKLPKPTPNDVAGSHHWWAKADNAITVWRDTAADNQMVEIIVQKIRFKHIGFPGLVELRYDRVTGRYFEKPSVVEINDYRRASGQDD